jgi:hypothetical protein
MEEITKKLCDFAMKLDNKDPITNLKKLNGFIKEIYPINNVIYNTNSLIFTFLKNDTITINEKDILINGETQSEVYMQQNNWLKNAYNIVTNSTKYTVCTGLITKGYDTDKTGASPAGVLDKTGASPAGVPDLTWNLHHPGAGLKFNVNGIHNSLQISKEDEAYAIEYVYNLVNTTALILDFIEMPPTVHAVDDRWKTNIHLPPTVHAVDDRWKTNIHNTIDKFIEDIQVANKYTFNPDHITCIRDKHGIYIKYYDPEDRYNIADEEAYKRANDPWHSYFN